eukprot:15364449-Ditylum_brightwellii.AAC.2
MKQKQEDKKKIAINCFRKEGGAMMGGEERKGPGKKEHLSQLVPSRKMEKANKAKKDSGKKGNESASKSTINNDKNNCCCDKDGGAGGRKKGGKKGDMAPPELKIELNLTTTCVNDKYTDRMHITIALLTIFGISAMAKLICGSASYPNHEFRLLL